MPQNDPVPRFHRWSHYQSYKAQEEANYRCIYRRYSSMPTLLDLSTEVLIDILSFLPAADLFSMRRVCHTIRDIVDGTAYLQYILRTDIMGVDDLLPPDFPISDRLQLLRGHEQSRNALQFNLFTNCFLHLPSYTKQIVLQGGYLIYDHLTADGIPQYGYTDLCAATRNDELRWVYIRVDNSCLLSPSRAWSIFAVDHNLVVVMRFVFFQIPSSAQKPMGLTVIANSKTGKLPRHKSHNLPSLNSRQAHPIPSHQHIMCCFRFRCLSQPVILSLGPNSWEMMEITFWYQHGSPATRSSSTRSRGKLGL
jgi:hypothetical protein